MGCTVCTRSTNGECRSLRSQNKFAALARVDLALVGQREELVKYGVPFRMAVEPALDCHYNRILMQRSSDFSHDALERENQESHLACAMITASF